MIEMALYGQMSPEEIKAFEDEQLRLVDRAVAQAKLSRPPVSPPVPLLPVTVETDTTVFWEDSTLTGDVYYGEDERAEAMSRSLHITNRPPNSTITNGTRYFSAVENRYYCYNNGEWRPDLPA